MLTGKPSWRSLRRNQEFGVSYLWVLVTVALLAIGSALAGTIYAIDLKREREQELLRIGREFRAALLAYYEVSPGAKKFPPSLDDLLRDPRFPGIKRHLRRIYADPITGKAEWGVVRIGDQIVGVHSLSDRAPLKLGNFEPDEADFTGKVKYSDWIFIASPPDPTKKAKPSEAVSPVTGKPVPGSS